MLHLPQTPDTTHAHDNAYILSSPIIGTSYRRPTMPPQNPQELIDLTGDSPPPLRPIISTGTSSLAAIPSILPARAPMSGRRRTPAQASSNSNFDPLFNEIIDVDSLPDRPTPSSFFSQQRAPSQGDIEIMYERIRFSHPPQASSSFSQPYPPPRQPQGFGGLFPLMSQPGQAGPVDPLRLPGFRREGFGGRIHEAIQSRIGYSGWEQSFDTVWQPVFQNNNQLPPFEVPGDLNYDMRAPIFGAAPESPPPENPWPPVKTKEKPIPPAREGFTRSPTSDDIIVCPRCDQELGNSEDDDKQRSIWVAKCGHVYCGKCNDDLKQATPKSRGPKAKKQAKNYCSVEDCGFQFKGSCFMWEVYV